MITNFFNKAFAFQLLLLLAAIAILPNSARSQKRQLTASSKVVKVAFIDHSMLRKEYKQLAVATKKIAAENNLKYKAYTEELKTLDKHIQKRLKADSLKGGQYQDNIMNENSAKRTALIENYQSGLKQRMNERAELVKAYEKKIIIAIETIVNEGGFTDVKPIETKTAELRGTDITDLILKKLN